MAPRKTPSSMAVGRAGSATLNTRTECASDFDVCFGRDRSISRCRSRALDGALDFPVSATGSAEMAVGTFQSAFLARGFTGSSTSRALAGRRRRCRLRDPLNLHRRCRNRSKQFRRPRLRIRRRLPRLNVRGGCNGRSRQATTTHHSNGCRLRYGRTIRVKRRNPNTKKMPTKIANELSAPLDGFAGAATGTTARLGGEWTGELFAIKPGRLSGCCCNAGLAARGESLS